MTAQNRGGRINDHHRGTSPHINHLSLHAAVDHEIRRGDEAGALADISAVIETA
jgi:hypothetical protein